MRVTLKICGITSATDAHAAVEAGASYLGFIFHPASPRAITREQFVAWRDQLPSGAKRVAVVVEPTLVTLAELLELGIDAFQVHFEPTLASRAVPQWAEAVGPARLWLAPKLPPSMDVAPEWLPLAGTFLLDTYSPDKFGGTGKTGDWEKFQRHRLTHPGKTWILSGGLNPQNLASALSATGATFVDVNSGVESAPGKKDRAKLEELKRVGGW